MDQEAQNCRETILDDVVEVSILHFDCSTFSRPQNVPSTTIAISGEYTVAASFHISDISASFLIAESPAVSLSSARGEQGLLYTHEVSMVTAIGMSECEMLVSALQTVDFAILYRKADGSKSLSLPCPNTSIISIEETDSSATVKVRMQSLSGYINLIN